MALKKGYFPMVKYLLSLNVFDIKATDILIF